ncbi:CocE/NonD family hydrolase [Spirosoma endbachense]|uniref:CocE/NonD family hydrolase n=1 Tax=Spirosoma endbachense TaxID=2666025 RepID=A0A6P1W8W6_9BACT|nr:CocE/NonD family hydrolase [Spirosoma endbachense]QHW01009.1 CocE/NonD family hydrolase [Spirosoma endbachense]
MIHRLFCLFCLFSLLGLLPGLLCAQPSPTLPTAAQDSLYLRQTYQKREVMVPMRDGTRLFTQIYAPKDTLTPHPILLWRTPFGCQPYGPDLFRRKVGPNPFTLRDNYIMVYQDVRGRWASEGSFVQLTPHLDQKKTPTQVDEASDTYDTIDWLLDNLPGHNGRVGQWGSSYPGFFTSAGSLSGHPALVASSPQAPVSNLWRDDAFHNGAFMLAANFRFYRLFQPHPKPTQTNPPALFEADDADGYRFYLSMGPTANSETGYYRNRNPYYHENVDHPTYDAHWQRRTILPHLRGIKHAILVVGGWFDAEDLYGTFHTYQAIEGQNPGIQNRIVVGPWVHGGWIRPSGQTLADQDFGTQPLPFYQQTIEAPFFRHYLLDPSGPFDLPEATLFETGTNRWRTFDTYPPRNLTSRTLYLQAGGKLGFEAPTAARSFSEFLSDPAHPVPYSPRINDGFSKDYMVDDQRFALARPDVLTFQTEPLGADLTLAGPILANLLVSTTGTDADWVVKLVDAYPADTPPNPAKPGVVFAHYQQLVRMEILRGKYRNNPSQPQPFQPGRPTAIAVELQDVLHTFKKGHRLLVQVQSSCFPWADRNPQTFVDIFQAKPGDYQKATHRVYHGQGAPSRITVGIL